MRRGQALLVFSLWITMIFVWSIQSTAPVLAQTAATATPGSAETPIEAPDLVTINPGARDEQIRQRLQNILEATGWFINPQVTVKDGVVFLTGQAKTADYKRWAGDLARATQDVAAVVNQIELTQPDIWDFQPAVASLRTMWLNLIRSLPLFGFSLFVLAVTWALTRLSMRLARFGLRKRFPNPLINKVIAFAIGSLVFLIGLYIVFQVAGLADVALTVLGGTGIIGLVLGIAFRDITENFLASIFLSLQNPFAVGDLVQIGGTMGFVQVLTTRVTILMTLDGNHIQIPNTIVYKSNILNLTSNPNVRMDFVIGIGFSDSITTAQEIAMGVLKEHPAVLKDPEPWVLVESLGNSSVNLRIYFWIDGSKNSTLKVKSSIIRLVKHEFQAENISIPDSARERFFPNGLTVQMLQPEPGSPGELSAQASIKPKPNPAETPDSIAVDAEDLVRSEADIIQEQARHARNIDQKDNLLKPSG